MTDMIDRGPGSVDDSRRSHEPSPDDVMAQLLRVLSSPEFAQSGRLQKFLRFIVEETLAGRADALKEYTIALEVFGRDDSFDPQTSSIVRVEASRLRGKLEKYNAIDGRNDPVCIDLPPGSYVPTFHLADQDIEPSGKDLDSAPMVGALRPERARVAVIVLVVMIVVGAAAFLLLDLLYPRPNLAMWPRVSIDCTSRIVMIVPPGPGARSQDWSGEREIRVGARQKEVSNRE